MGQENCCGAKARETEHTRDFKAKMNKEVLDQITSGRNSPRPLAGQRQELNSQFDIDAEMEISDGISDNDRSSIPRNYLDKVSINPNQSSPTKLKKMVSIINKEEYKQNKKRIDEIWEKYDVSKNGVLEKTEAFVFLRDMFRDLFGTESTDEDLESTFKMVDSNNNGVIEKQELHTVISSLMDGECGVTIDPPKLS